MIWRFDLYCPKCGKVSETTSRNYDPPPHVNCGDCLMDKVEVVEMKILTAERLKG